MVRKTSKRRLPAPNLRAWGKRERLIIRYENRVTGYLEEVWGNEEPGARSASGKLCYGLALTLKQRRKSGFVTTPISLPNFLCWFNDRIFSVQPHGQDRGGGYLEWGEELCDVLHTCATDYANLRGSPFGRRTWPLGNEQERLV